MTSEDREMLKYLISIGLVAAYSSTHPGTDMLMELENSPEIWDADMDVTEANEVLKRFML
jgi:hypothetical protein